MERSHKNQFSLAFLFAVVAGCAALAAVVRLLASLPGWVGWEFDVLTASVLFGAPPVCLALALVGLLTARDRDRQKLPFALAALLTLLTVLIGSALVAWHTVGEVRAGLFFFAVPVAVLPALVCATGCCRASIAVSLLFVVYAVLHSIPNSVLLVRLKRMQAEALAFAEHAADVRRQTGTYPADLSSHRFLYPELRPLIKYWSPQQLKADNYVFHIDLFKGDSNSREYSPSSGWYYYPD